MHFEGGCHMSQKFTCDIVELRPEPGMTLRALERQIRERHFSDFGDYKTRIVRATLPLNEASMRPALFCEKGGTPGGMAWAVLEEMHLASWLPAAPDKRLLAKFAAHEGAASFMALADQVLDLQCGDDMGMSLASVALTEAWNDFLVEAAPDIFKGGIYHQLLWLEAVNNFEDCLTLGIKPLDRIPAFTLHSYISQAKEGCYRELMGEGNIISLQSRKALTEVRALLDKCLGSFNRAAERAIHPGMLGAYIDALVHDYGLEPGKKDGGVKPKP
jgi:hypothetical protein